MEGLEEHLIEAREEYDEARRKAKLIYAKAVSQGQNGYLPALEGILEHSQIAAEQRIGRMEIPLHRIVGTVTHSRARSFSPGFLPLPKQRSEFGAKWVNVYIHQLDSGIQEPVLLQEYLNWYWVVEGNKRVSVLKYLDSYKIDARVIRVLPSKDSEDPAVAVYYRFLDFKNKTGLDDIWIRIPGGYERLYNYLLQHYGSGPDSPDSREKFQEFYSDIYQPFRALFKEVGGDKLQLTTGEAFLNYLELVGFPDSFSGEQGRKEQGRKEQGRKEQGRRDQSRRSVEQVVKELSLGNEEIAVTSEPLGHPSPGILGTIGSLLHTKKPLRVAFVHYGNSAISVWTRHHERAREYLQKQMQGRVKTKVFWTGEGTSSFREVIEGAASQSDVVFSTAAILYGETRKVAIENPNVRFYVASRKKSGVHIRTYSPRTHEVHFLSGMIAGALCEKRPISFVVSNYSAYAFASINAFALGARGVHKDARITLSWNDHWDKNHFKMDSLPEGVKEEDEFFFHNILPPPESGFREYGLYAWRGKKLTQYAELTYDWREFYRSVIENILAGNLRTFDSQPGEPARFLTFWGGLKNGIIDLSINHAEVGHEIRRTVGGIKTLMLMGEFSPFTGPLIDRQGKLQLEEGEDLEYDEIIAMDYLVEGIEGPFVDPTEVVTS